MPVPHQQPHLCYDDCLGVVAHWLISPNTPSPSPTFTLPLSPHKFASDFTTPSVRTACGRASPTAYGVLRSAPFPRRPSQASGLPTLLVPRQVFSIDHLFFLPMTDPSSYLMPLPCRIRGKSISMLCCRTSWHGCLRRTI